MGSPMESFLPMTLEGRKAYKSRGRKPKKRVTTALMDLVDAYNAGGRTLDGVPRESLFSALKHVQDRLSALSKIKQNNRVRVQTRWLRRWQTMINQTL